jgi:predicted nucleic acid-binding protein
MAKVFLDTNVIVYSMDKDAGRKFERAREVMRSLGEEDVGVISTQVIQEAYVTTTGKLGMDPLVVKGDLRLLDMFEVVMPTPELVFKAIDCAILNTLSFWDALIIAAAASANCEEVWTEDMNDGQTIFGVRLVHPFADLDDTTERES